MELLLAHLSLVEFQTFVLVLTAPVLDLSAPPTINRVVVPGLFSVVSEQ